jgi:hypothetical protein
MAITLLKAQIDLEYCQAFFYVYEFNIDLIINYS